MRTYKEASATRQSATSRFGADILSLLLPFFRRRTNTNERKRASEPGARLRQQGLKLDLLPRSFEMLKMALLSLFLKGQQRTGGGVSQHREKGIIILILDEEKDLTVGN